MIDTLYKIAKHPVTLITLGVALIVFQCYMTN